MTDWPLPCLAFGGMTLPLGPQETQQSWYASSRLGIYVCTLVCWGAGLAVSSPRTHFFCSRIKEKGAAYSMTIMQNFLDTLATWSQVREVVARLQLELSSLTRLRKRSKEHNWPRSPDALVYRSY